MYFSYTALIIISILLIIQDFKKQEVNIVICILYVCLCIHISHGFSPWPIIIFALIGLLYKIRNKQAFGIADYIIIFGSSFIVGDNWYYFITECGIFGVLLCLFYQKTIPFIPAIILATAVHTLLIKLSYC